MLVNLLFRRFGFEIVDWYYNCFTTLLPNIIMVIFMRFDCELMVVKNFKQ